MTREPINPDDPDLTAYALGELNAAERREFEAKLDMSPGARVELESMDEIMSLLSKGLKNEWTSELNGPSLEVLPELAAGEKIVPFSDFRNSRKVVRIVAAAAAAVVLFAGALVSFQSVPVNTMVMDETSVSGEVLVASLGDVPGLHVPRLEVASEAEDIGNLSLSEAIENFETLTTPVDASYLESNAVVSASQQSMSASTGVVPASFSGRPSERVDSYLPPVSGQKAPTTGLIERRVKKGEAIRVPVGNSSSVLVRGFVSLDEVSGSLQDRHGNVLHGFQPVSMSANPVRSSEDDLRLMAELQTIQKEISVVAQQLPVDSEERTKLLGLLERNRSAIAGLKAQFAR